MSNFTKKSKRFLFIPALAAAVLCGGFATAGVLSDRFERATAHAKMEISKEIETEYAFGDVFTIPECTFTEDGQSAKGIASLQYPDGTQRSEGEHTLDQSGNYVLRYIATLGGKTYTKEYPFSVVGRLANYQSSKTSVEYGHCTHLGANSDGLMVRIASGDSITFDHVFHMSELSVADKLVQGFIVPDVQGTADFSKMVFTFTDVEDPSVSLTYNGNFHNDTNAHGLTYFTAAGDGQIQTGLETVGRLHVGTTLGCMVPHSFLAVDTGLFWGMNPPVPAAPDAKQFCISYDAQRNQAWAGGKIIADMDDSNYYSSLWFGFPSGKAKLTISALNYNNASANMCFTEILGIDLRAQTLVDEEAPIIKVENSYETMPNGIVGSYYPIPAASARDMTSGECDVKVTVWHGYGTPAAKMVDFSGNRFKPQETGEYAIVYEATDYSGNTAREILWVRAYKNQGNQLTVKIDESYPTDLQMGVWYDLPDVAIMNNSGDTEVSFTVEQGKTKCQIVDGKFCLESKGEWVLTCVVTDYIGNGAADVCVLNAEYGGKPILASEPVVPVAFIANEEYVLPVARAYDYASGKVEKICKVTVDGKEYTSGDTFKPVAKEGQSSVKLVYTCDGVILREREVPVVSVITQEKIPGAGNRVYDAINVERYLYSEGGLTVTPDVALGDYDGMYVTATEDAAQVKTTYINPQLANAFSVRLVTVPVYSKFAAFSVRLTDAENPNVSVLASFAKADGYTAFTVGDTELALEFDFDAATATPYEIGFAKGKLLLNGSTSVNVAKMENGEKFAGFPSGKIYFELILEDVKADGAIFIRSICGTSVNNTVDQTGPYVERLGTMASSAFKDSIYTVEGVVACDVLCPNTVAYLTVTTPSGGYAKDVNGLILQDVDAKRSYDIQLGEYGEYYISVRATEAAESAAWMKKNDAYVDYKLTVTDGERPTITFQGDFPTSLKVGEALVIPSYTVSDNHTPSDQIRVMKLIINPKGMPVYLYGDTNAVTCEYAGVYKVYIYVYDASGNLTTLETSVTVG